jgi:hypothetical protein
MFAAVHFCLQPPAALCCLLLRAAILSIIRYHINRLSNEKFLNIII